MKICAICKEEIKPGTPYRYTGHNECSDCIPKIEAYITGERMKLEGKIDTTILNGRPLWILENENVHILSCEYDTPDLAKQAAEKFAEEHDMTIKWGVE